MRCSRSARSTRRRSAGWPRELGLAVSDKPDSHEICFVADGDHAEFLEEHGVAKTTGAIRDVAGRVVGTHDGVHRFTVGQRKGLGLSSPVRLYVVGIDAAAGSGDSRSARGAGAD